MRLITRKYGIYYNGESLNECKKLLYISHANNSRAQRIPSTLPGAQDVLTRFVVTPDGLSQSLRLL